MITICNHDDISGITPEEYFTHYCQDENAKIAYEESIEDTAKLKKEMEDTDKRLEAISEQLYFANELIESIEYHLEKETRMSEFKKTFRGLLEESSLER